MKWIRWLFILTFIGLIYFPLVNNYTYLFTGGYKKIGPRCPVPDLQHLDAFPKKYETFFDKWLTIKPWLVEVNSRLKIQTLGISPNPEKVIIGTDGWLFLGGKNVHEYRGTNLFSAEELMKIKKRLHERATYALEKYHAHFYVAIAPLKHTIYPEYLPLAAKKIEPRTRYDQVIDLFKNDPLVHAVDLRGDLYKAKSGHQLYYKTDNHWNYPGAFAGYQAIVAELQHNYPAISPIENNYFTLDSSTQIAGGEAEMMNAADLFSEKRFIVYPTMKCKAKDGVKKEYPSPAGFPYPYDYEIVKETGNPSLPDALIIRDSFTDALVPFLSENFNHSVFIFDAWQYGSNHAIMDNEKPQLLMYIILESNLEAFLEYE